MAGFCLHRNHDYDDDDDGCVTGLQSSGAFVYGVMSFFDKVSNGAAVMIIQTMHDKRFVRASCVCICVHENVCVCA